MTIYTWKDFPVSGSAGFESSARDALASNKANCVLIDDEIEAARGGYSDLDARLDEMQLSGGGGGGGILSETVGMNTIKLKYNGDDSFDLEYGTVHIDDGVTSAFYVIPTTITKSVTVAAADLWYYIYATAPGSGTELTNTEIEYSLTVPVLSTAKKGYYKTGDASSRLIGYIGTVSNGVDDVIRPFQHNGDQLMFSVISLAEESGLTTTPATIQATTLVGVESYNLWFSLGFIDDSSAVVTYATGTNTNLFTIIGIMYGVSYNTEVHMWIMTDSTGQFDIKTYPSGSSDVQMAVNGLIFPREVYNGHLQGATSAPVILSGTDDPPSATGLDDGTLYFKYTV